jgi:hypothetical protein
VLVGSWEDRSGYFPQLILRFCIKGPLWFTEITYSDALVLSPLL